MLLQFAAGVVALTFCVWEILRFLPAELRNATPTMHSREWMGSAVPMAVTEVLRIVEGQYAIILIGLALSVSDAGIYRVAVAVVGFVGLPSTLINLVVMPFAAKFKAEGDQRRLQRLATLSSLAMSAAVWILTIGIFLVGKPFIALVFGKAFAPGWAPLVLMSLAYCINAAFGSSSTVLNMCGCEQELMVLSVCSLALGMALTWFLLRHLGVDAAPVAMILSESIKGVVGAIIARRQLGVNTSFLSLQILGPAEFR